jgi:hypothetical protein
MAILPRVQSEIPVITWLSVGRGTIGHDVGGGTLACQKIKGEQNEAKGHTRCYRGLVHLQKQCGHHGQHLYVFLLREFLVPKRSTEMRTTQSEVIPSLTFV